MLPAAEGPVLSPSVCRLAGAAASVAAGALCPCLSGGLHEPGADHPAQSWEPAVLCLGLFTSHEFFVLRALAKV